MRHILANEAKDDFKFWESVLDENVLLFSITDDYEYIISAVAEINENSETPTLRVLLYGDSKGWKLSDAGYENLYTNGLFNVVIGEHEKHAGDIYFAYEQGTNSGYEKYDTAFDLMCGLVEYMDFITVLEMSETEFSGIFDVLRPGDYMIHILYSEKR